MPARDGKGSMKVGSRMRRGRGRRGRAADEAVAVADPYRDCGLGWGYWPRAGGRGMGRGKGSARAGRRAEVSADPVATEHQRETFLRRRMWALTEELDRVQALLSEYSRSDAPDEA
jgi:hypothetical protein